jgi:hypothetical protein
VLFAAAGGGVLLLVVVFVFAFGGGGGDKDKHPAPAPEPAPEPAAAVAPEPTEPAPTPEPPTAPAAKPVAGGDSTTSIDTATGSSSSPAAAPARPPVAKTPMVGGKPVVLEYDDKSAAKTAVMPEDAAAVARARASYAAGTQRLFAGDNDSAIREYKQALATYPGYVAGYRGLGLAYAQQGDNAKALQALRTYVGLVPAAKDAPLIRKRISTLQPH